MSEYPEFDRLKAQSRHDAALAPARVLTLEQQAAWGEWVASRPPAIADLCRRFPPTRLLLAR